MYTIILNIVDRNHYKKKKKTENGVHYQYVLQDILVFRM